MAESCNHEHWDIYDSSTMGFGICYDCNKQIPLSELFRNLKGRMEAALAKIESKP
jgi:RNA polymerase-binding transcription factor DksA